MMCVMVVSSTEKLASILLKLRKIDISHLYFYNTEAPKGLGAPLISLVPFTNMLVCEDCVLESPDFHKGMLLHEAKRMDIPVLSETGLDTILLA